MLINFSVKNFRSIRDYNTFSLLKRGHKNDIPENSFHTNGLSQNQELLKTSIIYGGNASGKSNLIRSIYTMQAIIKNKGVENESVITLLNPFRLDNDSNKKPILFDAEFIVNNRRFRYGFECTGRRIVSEWLFAQKQRMTLLFAREGNKFVKSSPDFSELITWKKVIAETDLKLPEGALFLSTAATMFSGGVCELVRKWFEDTLVVLSAETYQQYLGYTFESIKDPKVLSQISSLISKADFGIQRLEANITEKESKIPDKKEFVLQVATKHIVDGKTYDLDMFYNESAGTQKIFSLSAPLIDVLKKGKVLFIDELDASLHPLLVCNILEMFHAENKNNAQMIITTHAITIFTESMLRFDQVWFAEKEKDGSSSFIPLSSFHGIRKNWGAIEKDYLHGCFGGIPSIKKLSWED